MIGEVLHLSVQLSKLERKIKNANITELVTYPSEDYLDTKRLIECAKPNMLLGESFESSEPRKAPKEESTPTPEKTSQQVVDSFNEVLRLAKSGQQTWWTDDTKNSTDLHIQRVQKYYETHIK
jgi:hypothetical protein